MRKTLIIILGMMAFMVHSQIDTTFQLVSKMDIAPQFELHDGELIEVMGFTQSIGGAIDVPGPTIILEEGDSVKIDLWNLSQGAPHTVHLHGLDVDQQNDGVPMLSFDVPHDEIRSYYLKVPHPGTYIYHCHEVSVLHVQAGMYGMLVVKPKDNPNQTWDGGFDYMAEQNWLMSEIDIDWHHDTIINHGPMPVMGEHVVLDYDPTYFLVNGRSEGQLEANDLILTGNAGSNTLLRLANIGYYGNEVILPAELNAQIISSDGRVLPQVVTSDTIVVLPGERYSVLVNSNERFSGTAQVNYFNLNTNEVENTQFPKIDIDYALSIAEMEEVQLEIFPNPTSGLVHINLTNFPFTETSITVRNVAGQVLSSTAFKNIDKNFEGKEFIYGLPELDKEVIKSAKYIANPGCFATAIQLAILPLAANGLLKDDVHINAVTGATGAGTSLSATTHYTWRDNNFSYYKPFTHQHLGEINQSVNQLQNDFSSEIIFMPNRGNFSRGIFATLYTDFEGTVEEAKDLYNSFYATAKFTFVSDEFLHMKQVVNTNKCLIHLHKYNGKLLITSVVDNLLKGASGQAVQNMNLMFGLEETTGLGLKATYF